MNFMPSQRSILTSTGDLLQAQSSSVSMGDWYHASLKNDFGILGRLISGFMGVWLKDF